MSPDPAMASALADPTHALEPLEPCATARPTWTAVPLDRSADRELDAALADVVALRWAGQLDAALDRASEAVARADEHDDASGRSAARLELGLTQMDAGEYEPSLETLAAAYWLAETQGDARKAARASAAIVTVLGSYLEQPTRADAWVARARAALAALDSPGEEAFELDNALGSLAEKQGDHETALRHYERAASIAAGDPEITAAKAAIVLQNLATTLEQLGRWDDAEARYDEARAALERELGSTHPSLGLVWHNLAIFNHTRGRTDAAVASARRALQVKEATLPPRHLSIAVTLHALGTILQDRDDTDEAEAVLLRAEEIVDATVGRDHPLKGALLVNLADLASRRDDLLLAERRFDEGIAALERTYDATHELVLQARAHRAMLWNRQGRRADALDELESVYATIERTQGAQAVALLHIGVEVAELLRERGDCDEAGEYFRRIVADGDGRLPHDDRVLVRAREGLFGCGIRRDGAAANQ
jgi:tetratricopeptide (TPR) repeat protein